MFANLRTLIKDVLTARDGVTYAPARVYWMLAALQFLMLSAWSVLIQKSTFDPVAYGTGAGLIIAAGGVGVWITRKSDEG
ncbi:amino acid ABC transporter substrate-binding protein [Polymorphobacter arshaanensis]|uniref:Amino acid ABC transporter substrate-binding protein n=1 Tax=Glacieibacterium arshaanense TaxID=2511025 RepID=A0A4Y9ETA7_9SPHN|nr:amino acid ABC transporter substrate-binding protein [Polymorphobacter arshaanensis]TFU06148.1 amino acid ABC transporter substrate-binding protein [Polymorphobacter arshaanensis]